jgi:hypothetical protein
MIHHRRLIVLILSASIHSAIACAQTPAPLHIGPLTLTGNLRSRVEGWDWFRDGAADHDYAFSGSLLRLAIGRQTRRVEWQAEMAVPILLGLPDNAIAPGTQGQLGLGAAYFISNDRRRNAASVFFKQGYLRLKDLGGKEAQSLRFGRFEYLDGSETTPKDTTLAAIKRDRVSQRLVGNFGFSHVGRSLDGAQYVYNRPKFNFTVTGARPTRGVFQVDGWGELPIALATAVATGVTQAKHGVGEWRLFALQYNDWRDVLKTDNRPTTARQADRGDLRITTLGADYMHVLNTASGKWDLLLWGVLQTGRWGTLDHRAGAAVAEAGYQPAIKLLKPWIRFGYNYGSGDGDLADRAHNTFFQILPTPRVYARFPLYNMMNTRDLFAEVILRPLKSLTVRSDVHSLRLANRSDLWYQGGGAFQPWTFGYTGRPSSQARSLATIIDVSADVQVNARFSLTAYFAAAQGKSVVSGIYPNGKNARYAYLEGTYRF